MEAKHLRLPSAATVDALVTAARSIAALELQLEWARRRLRTRKTDPVLLEFGAPALRVLPCAVRVELRFAAYRRKKAVVNGGVGLPKSVLRIGSRVAASRKVSVGFLFHSTQRFLRQSPRENWSLGALVRFGAGKGGAADDVLVPSLFASPVGEWGEDSREEPQPGDPLLHNLQNLGILFCAPEPAFLNNRGGVLHLEAEPVTDQTLESARLGWGMRKWGQLFSHLRQFEDASKSW